MLKDSISSNKIKWVYRANASTNRVAALIPQYNELSKGFFMERLSHFNKFAKLNSEIVDVIIIDDGSKDNSLRVMEWFVKDNLASFDVISIKPNTDKIGALYLTTLYINYDYILFSDFDTDLENLEYLPNTLFELDNNPSLMGCYFRMLPIKQLSPITKYQQFEYAIHRIWYKYTSAEGSVAVMPGAGSLYKRDILIKILGGHSGIRNGEDRETTVMGINLGYKAIYEKQIIAFTRTPKTISELISQRARWNLGYIETLFKEKKYYLKKTISFTVIGTRFFTDLLSVLFLLLFPIIIIILGILNIKICLLTLFVAYAVKLFWVYLISVIGKGEIEGEKTDFLVLLSFPIFKLIIEFPSWSLATFRFFITDYSNECINDSSELKKLKDEVPIKSSNLINFQKTNFKAKKDLKENTLN